MRKFAYVPECNYEKDPFIPELKEGNPCYQASVYDPVMYDETPDGDLIQCDMTQILLNQEKYRRLLGDESLPVSRGEVAVESVVVKVSPGGAVSKVFAVVVASAGSLDSLVQVVVVAGQDPGLGGSSDDSVVQPLGIAMPISRGIAHSIGTLACIAHWAATSFSHDR